jgi:uncharacterized protein (DUF2225 family)
MSDFETKWSKIEFKTYLLVYCANADYVETEEEKEIIMSKVQKEVLKKIHKEFDNDNDYQRIQKIVHTANRFSYTHEKADVLLEKMKGIFFPKGYDMSSLEANMFRGLKHLLS